MKEIRFAEENGITKIEHKTPDSGRLKQIIAKIKLNKNNNILLAGTTAEIKPSIRPTKKDWE